MSIEIFPDSVNTIRVVTIKNPQTGKYSIAYAIHRFGVNETKPADNASKGAMFAMVDLDTGMLSEAKNYYNITSDTHLETGKQIKGVKVPNWEEIKKVCLDTHKQFSQIPFIGWDIAVSDDGYKVIEANKASGFGIYQSFGKGLRYTELGDIYRYYTGIK